ncbi:MAG: transglutaminase-like cysteine peptidase [Burkholderiales bacterium]|nr:transglutaminase-like cysteine peptidase [Burkholderiales bacterium]
MKGFGWILLFVACAFAAEQAVLSDRLIAYVGKKYGQEAKQRVLEWQKVMEKGKNAPVPDKLRLANDFFNRVTFVSDLEHWGKEDYWATPVEMLATNGGDCEDFAIGKYFTLLAMGVPMERLRITYVRALQFNPVNQAHMVLAYYATPDADPLILDNLDKTIWPGSQRDDLMPIYSFNGGGLWLAKERGEGRQVGKADRIGFWNEMIERMNKEANQ